MKYREIEKRLQAAGELLQTSELSPSTFKHLQTLLSGINAKTDTLLASISKELKHVEDLQKGEIVELTLEGLPEVTPEQRKHKKALLLLIALWKDLKNEVSRIEKELAQAHHQTPNRGSAGAVGRIIAGAKGPVGMVTLVAVGLVALKMTEVSVVIQNVGCDPVTPVSSVAVNIPGLKLPSETISPGGSGVARLPPLRATVDATSPKLVKLTMYGITYNFSLGDSDIKLIFDGKTLNGTTSTIDLGDKKEHTFVSQCR